MADVRRTVSAIQALFANNTSGAISEQDARDFIVSTAPAYGALYITTAAATTLADASTPTKASGTTASVGASSDVTVATSNRITYTGAPTVYVLVFMSATMTCASSTQEIEMSIAKNGTQLEHSIIQRKIGTGSDKGAAGTFALVSLAQNDYIEAFVANNTSTGAITLTKMVMGMMSIFV